jgi:Spy/CpxP family protein refolding chaperone
MVNRTMTIRISPALAQAAGWLLLAFALSVAASADAAAQVRRPGRLQKKIEKMQERRENKLGPSTSAPGSSTQAAQTAPVAPESAAPKPAAQIGKHSLDGARERGPRGIFRDEERELVVPGFGNQVATILILRQLDLTDEQKQNFKAVRRSIGKQLAELMAEHRQLELQLTDAIYGENFDPRRAEELAVLVAEKQSAIIKLRAGIESKYRQILTPDQFYVFHFLIGEMVLPQRRIPPALLRQQMQQRRMGLPNRPNPPPQEP